MTAQKRHPDELRERAVKMVLEIRERDGKGQLGQDWIGAKVLRSCRGGILVGGGVEVELPHAGHDASVDDPAVDGLRDRRVRAAVVEGGYEQQLEGQCWSAAVAGGQGDAGGECAAGRAPGDGQAGRGAGRGRWAGRPGPVA